MPRMEIDIDVPAFLHAKLESCPESLQEYFLRCEEMWERKLWKQLTDLLMTFYALPESKPYRLDMYNSFISTFSKHINQLKLVTFGIATAKEYTDKEDALTFMQTLAKQVDHETSSDAFVFATIETSRLMLDAGNLEGSRAATQKAGLTLDSFDAVDPVIHAAFYQVSAEYYKLKADFAPYYRTSLLYLACVKLEDIPVQELQMRARDLSLAALLGSTIYHFGELLLHPVLDTLAGTPHAWLKDFVAALNAGDTEQFEKLSVNIPKEPELQSAIAFLRQKICLMALIEAVFKRPAHERILNFETIASETNLPVQEVEYLLMKALSLKLIKGSIDQVDASINISWVQPRVLNMQQIGSMHTRLLQWSTDVKKLEKHMKRDAAAFIEVA